MTVKVEGVPVFHGTPVNALSKYEECIRKRATKVELVKNGLVIRKSGR